MLPLPHKNKRKRDLLLSNSNNKYIDVGKSTSKAIGVVLDLKY